ncbi:glycosyltransferase family 2 protein [Snuella lapsa]|uniref:Glycosyltransferase family 2 protein n=1 Tax=Snuella lapsa TaxID=870481 RepID=A0ABP6XYY3_9FLAO
MKDVSTQISALLITYNEIEHIDAVIDNISFADEIIAIDSFSTDGTYERLKSMEHVKVLQREFINFADQRNFAIKQANYNWVLFIDADERISTDLTTEILCVTKSPDNFTAFKFKRNFVFEDRIMRFSGLQSDSVFRLFIKGTSKYKEDRIVHEILEIQGNSKTLENTMLHYSFSDYNSYKAKAEHYAKLKALELFQKGKKPNAFHFYLKPIYKFTINYFLRLGFLDGKAGYTICALNAYGVYYRYQELKRLIRS